MSGFEKKFGKYAIKRLSLILIICYGVGYLLQLVAPDLLYYLQLNPFEIIHHFQIWRLFTWILIPPDSFGFFTLIMLYFYYSLGTSLEMVWGTYRYNVYLFSGFLFTVAGSFIAYGICSLCGQQILWDTSLMHMYGSKCYADFISTYYVNMSIFLAYAATFPDSKVYIFFILPVKVKILGIIYGALLVYELVSYIIDGNLALCILIGVSLLNFVLFFFMQRKKLHWGKAGAGIRYEYRKASEKVQLHKDTKEAKKERPVTRHKCAVCGKTDVDSPNLSFRFCSKCNGNYEYCELHLFTHKHVE